MQQRLCAAVALCVVAWSCGQQQATATAGVPSGGSVLKPFYAAEHKEMKDKFVSDHPNFAAYGKRFLKENEQWVKNRPVAPL